MKKKDNKKYIYLLLLVLIMSIIFLFSSQSNDKSQTISNKVIEVTKQDVVTNVINENLDININPIILVRKGAHASLYFILAITCFLTLKEFKVKNTETICILLCLLYASSDEIHQIFIRGRTASILDVIIDMLGATFGVLLIYTIKKNRIN
ncbi:MAG: VanZ family protein [Erysipelotrichaceae bacterium]